MRIKRTIAAGAVLIAASTSSAQAAETVATQKAAVRSAEDRVNTLQARLGQLLTQMYQLNDEVAAASGKLGVTSLRLDRAERRVVEARTNLSTRAREAYMRGTWRNTQLLLGLDNFVNVITFGRYVGRAADSDLRAFRDLQAARDSLVGHRQDADTNRIELLSANKQLDDLRKEIQTTLAHEQVALSDARALLSQLEAKRRAEEEARRKALSNRSGVSAAVEARRSARQVILDQKLAALLAWYAPGAGLEPFMPPNLVPTGIVTTGLSSWYGPGFNGRRASSGATFREEQLTAASLVLPFGTLLKVTYNGKSAVVVITDRGPYIPGRVLDLSAGAAQAIGLSGVKEVRMEIVTPAKPAPAFP